MTDRWILTDMPWELTSEDVIKHLHITEDDQEDFEELFGRVMPLMKPVIYYGRAKIEDNDGHNVKIGGQVFTSRVLSVNLKNCEEVYPYVMTSGREAYEFGEAQDDFLMKYWAEQICEMALRRSSASGMKLITERLGYKNLYAMNPGSLENWPISQQKPLFDLLGNVFESCGVVLTPSYLMQPVKSGSGILFASEEHYANCMLCPRIGCPSRRAAFKPDMFREKYGD